MSLPIKGSYSTLPPQYDELDAINSPAPPNYDFASRLNNNNDNNPINGQPRPGQAQQQVDFEGQYEPAYQQRQVHYQMPRQLSRNYQAAASRFPNPNPPYQQQFSNYYSGQSISSIPFYTQTSPSSSALPSSTSYARSRIEAQNFASRVSAFNLQLFVTTSCSLVTLMFLFDWNGRQDLKYSIASSASSPASKYHCDADNTVREIDDFSFNLLDVRKMQYDLFIIGVILTLISFVKCCCCSCNINSRSPLYRFIVTLISAYAFVVASSIAYLSYFSACKIVSSGSNQYYGEGKQTTASTSIFDIPVAVDPYSRPSFALNILNVILFGSTFVSVVTI